MQVIVHSFCHILLVRSKSQVHPYSEHGNGQRHEYQQAGIMKTILESQSLKILSNNFT